MTESMVQGTGNPTTVEATDKHCIAMSDSAPCIGGLVKNIIP